MEFYDRDGNRLTEDEWEKMLGADRFVARDLIGDVMVSTVYFGINMDYAGIHEHPLIFETMSFGEPAEYDCKVWARTSTEAEALEAHAHAVAEVREREGA